MNETTECLESITDTSCCWICDFNLKIIQTWIDGGCMFAVVLGASFPKRSDPDFNQSVSRRHGCWFFTLWNKNTDQSRCLNTGTQLIVWQRTSLATRGFLPLMCCMLRRLLCRACRDMAGVHCFQHLACFNNSMFFHFSVKAERAILPPKVCHYCHSETRQESESQLHTASQNRNPILQCAVRVRHVV